MAKLSLFFPIVFVNPPSWWRQKMTSWCWCHDNDVMIVATFHWLLHAMWHANHLKYSCIGKSKNQTLLKKHEARFYEWNGAFWKFGQIRVISFRYPRWNIHARLACITCRRLENIATNFLQFCPHDFSFLLELSKIYWVCDLAHFEQGSVA